MQLIRGPFQCVYEYLQKKACVYIKNEMGKIIDDSNIQAFNLLTQNREAQKYALMCFFYNEMHLGRTTRWKKQFEVLFNTDVDNSNYKLLSEFSIEYSSFLNYVFPNLTKQLDLLNQAVKILANLDRPVQIGTLDGCLLEWDFDHTTSLKRNYYNPISNKHDQYRINISVRPNKGTIRQKIQKHRLSFRPNFIHSLDASIMRLFILRFYQETGKKLNHLHDCVLLHPNDVSVFCD